MKKKSMSYSLKLKVHFNGRYRCFYCGKVADKIDGGIAKEYNPYYSVEDLIRWEKEQYGRMKDCIFDIDIFISFEVDHVIPECKNGLTDISNLKLACRSCNRRKGSKYE